MSKVYSYHTFIYPFSWRDNGHNGFREFIRNSESWESTNMPKEDDFNSVKFDDNSAKLLFYKEYQYFTPYARKAIYGFEDGIVENYEFRQDDVHEKAYYYIKKGEKTYKLLINSIRLKIYNTDVALFVIEGENHGLDAEGKPQDTIEDIKNINDYGRRVSMPIMSGVNICADSLKIVFGKEIIEDKFEDAFIEFPKIQNIDNLSLTHISDIITRVISFNTQYTITSNSTKKDSDCYIYPLMDDRMYVMCQVVDKKTFDDYKTRSNLGNVYELTYIDPSGGLSCQDDEMCKELIEDAEYRRWVGYGSMYFITNYSFIFLAATPPPDYLIETFLTQYYQMTCLCIAQRASIMRFKYVAALEAKNIVGNSKIDIVKDIMELQEKFVRFDTQLYFEEVSYEQQAIELYDLLKKATFIEKEKEALKNQINTLYEVNNTSLEYRNNTTMLAFTFISYLTAIAALAVSTMQITGFKETLGLLEGGNDNCKVTLVVIAACLSAVIFMPIVVITILIIHKRGKKNVKKNR